MVSQKEKAEGIYKEMQVYKWCEYDASYIPDDKETKRKCTYMLDEIILLYGDKDFGEVVWWKEVKKYIIYKVISTDNLIMVSKANYKSLDGTIKKSIEINGKFYIKRGEI